MIEIHITDATIKISKRTKKELEMLKDHQRATYEDVIVKLINDYMGCKK